MDFGTGLIVFHVGGSQTDGFIQILLCQIVCLRVHVKCAAGIIGKRAVFGIFFRNQFHSFVGGIQCQLHVAVKITYQRHIAMCISVVGVLGDFFIQVLVSLFCVACVQSFYSFYIIGTFRTAEIFSLYLADCQQATCCDEY